MLSYLDIFEYRQEILYTSNDTASIRSVAQELLRQQSALLQQQSEQQRALLQQQSELLHQQIELQNDRYIEKNKVEALYERIIAEKNKAEALYTENVLMSKQIESLSSRLFATIPRDVIGMFNCLMLTAYSMTLYCFFKFSFRNRRVFLHGWPHWE